MPFVQNKKDTIETESRLPLTPAGSFADLSVLVRPQHFPPRYVTKLRRSGGERDALSRTGSLSANGREIRRFYGKTGLDVLVVRGQTVTESKMNGISVQTKLIFFPFIEDFVSSFRSTFFILFISLSLVISPNSSLF